LQRVTGTLTVEVSVGLAAQFSVDKRNELVRDLAVSVAPRFQHVGYLSAPGRSVAHRETSVSWKLPVKSNHKAVCSDKST